MRTTDGWYRSGGGSEPDESPEATLCRETLAECGREIEILKRVAEAVEHIGPALDENDGLIKHGVFFRPVGTSCVTSPD